MGLIAIACVFLLWLALFLYLVLWCKWSLLEGAVASNNVGFFIVCAIVWATPDKSSSAQSPAEESRPPYIQPLKN